MFNVCSGSPKTEFIRATIATCAAWDDPMARKNNHASHTTAKVIATRCENLRSRRRSSLGAKSWKRGMSVTTAYTPRIARSMMADVGCEATRPTNNPAATNLQRVSRRRTVDRMSRRRMNPRDCGDTWYCAHTAKRAVGKDAWRAIVGTNVARSSSKNARKVMPPATKGYQLRNSIGVVPLEPNKVRRTRKSPGQFAEYLVRSDGRRLNAPRFCASP